MTLTELKYIVALAHTKHVGRAAKQCFVSQPTLSIAVKKLEEELNITLFERAKHVIHITPAGEVIIAQAKKVLYEASQIKLLAQNASDPLSIPLRLGAIFTIGPYLYPRMVPVIKANTPDLPLYIEENYTAVLKEKLLTGVLDAVIIALPFQAKDVVVKSLYHEPFHVLLPKTHPLAQYDAIAASDLDPSELLLLGEGHCFRDQILEACPHLNAQTSDLVLSNNRTAISEGSSLETIRHMVALGMGITVLPESATAQAQYKDVLVTRPFKQPITREIAIAWRANFSRPVAMQAVLDALKVI